MIIVDTSVGSKELYPLINAMGVKCEKLPLSFGDACFDGNGPNGLMGIGIEVKRLHDMLQCIDDARYAGHQRVGMKKMYQVSILIIEGMWKPREDGILMESRNGRDYFPCRPGGRPVMYSKLRRYIRSIGYAGVYVNYTRNMWHTAYDICEEYHYHQKKWNDHTSMREIHKVAIPTLNTKASLVHKWANDVDDIGVKYSAEAARYFRKPVKLANSEETDWLRIGVGVATAQKIIRQINGW